MTDMSDLSPTNELSADRPLENPVDDQLGYAPFAQQLAKAIGRMSPKDGFVVAIYGEWGSGKSTVLNFITHYLSQLPEPDQPVVVKFNPWWFSGQEDLARRFFSQLLGVIAKPDVFGNKVAKQLGEFAELVSESSLVEAMSAALTISGVPLPVKDISKAVARVLKAEQRDIAKAKSELSEKLRKQKRRIVVTIDDIDRLTAEEMRDLFRLVRTVADFPNIVYLMAFDRQVVCDALGQIQGQNIPGEAYLEKIVQAPFELPPPEPASLQHMLFARLDEVFAPYGGDGFDPNYWRNMYFEAIFYFIRTPRDVARLVNSLSITFPAVAGEVNQVDFIAIETLRIFCPDVYDTIRNNAAMFFVASDLRYQIASEMEALRSF